MAKAAAQLPGSELAKAAQVREGWRTPEAVAIRRELKARHGTILKKRMLDAARQRAKAEGLPFDITAADIVIPERCPALGMTLISAVVSGSGKGSAASPSLDKIVPMRGYVRGNVQVISRLANTMKNCANPAQLKAFAKWILQAQDEAAETACDGATPSATVTRQSAGADDEGAAAEPFFQCLDLR